tara:strand:- start:2286 stop:2585 length:300 start_codon:yes stop_codon:yes gene_type:complete
MAVPSRPQHLAKPKPRRSDTGKIINLRASAKPADKKQGNFSNREWTRTFRGKFHLAKTILFILSIHVPFQLHQIRVHPCNLCLFFAPVRVHSQLKKLAC